MKLMKILAFLIINALFTTNILAAENDISIIDVDATNSNVLKIFMDRDLETNSADLTSDIKIFKDLNTETIIKDLENDKLLSINLSEDIKNNSSYSLLSVYWVEWSIDFRIDDLINWLEIIWNDTDWVEKISIINSRQLNVVFKNSIISDDVDVKILREYNIDSLQFNIDNKKELDVYLADKLSITSKYLVMVFSITTTENIVYTIWNSIYDFNTELLNDVEIVEPIVEVIDEVIDEENAIDNVALNSAATPNTWAETWILLLFTFIVSSLIYLRRKA